MDHHFHKTKKMLKNQSGFSLIEMAIFLAIFGLAIASIASFYNLYIQKKSYSDTNNNYYIVTVALKEFVSRNGRFPCPADPALPITSPNSGVEMRIPVGATHQCVSGVAAMPAASGGASRVAGTRHVGLDLNPASDPVAIGMLPYKTLGLSYKEAYDGWHNSYTYMISEYLTGVFPFVTGWKSVSADPLSGWGVIREFNYNPATNTDINVRPNVPFAIISHGPDGKGAYTKQGVLAAACGNDRDSENCNNDAIVLVNTGLGGVDSAVNEVKTASTIRPGRFDFYDDAMVELDISIESDKWLYGAQDKMSSKAQRVGIGLKNPNTELEVAGNIRAEKALSSEFCNQFGSNCFPTRIIAGTGINCNNGVMEGIVSANSSCVTTVDTSDLTTNVSCPIGSYLKGFDAGGNIICM